MAPPGQRTSYHASSTLLAKIGGYSLSPNKSFRKGSSFGDVGDFMDKIFGWNQSSSKQVTACRKFLVKENPSLPTVALDLDGTLVHTLVDPAQIAAAERRGFTGCRLPGTMGLCVQRPGLEELFSALSGYNVVIFSAGGSEYVHNAVSHLMAEHPSLQNRVCKILCRGDLTKYSESSELPSQMLIRDGVHYVKDLRKARQDGNAEKVIIIDDNPDAYQVPSWMKDEDFRNRYNFAMNAVLVPEFSTAQPEAFAPILRQVSQVLRDIRPAEDRLAAMHKHPGLKGGWIYHSVDC